LPSLTTIPPSLPIVRLISPLVSRNSSAPRKGDLPTPGRPASLRSNPSPRPPCYLS
jgi:hypothetical protein